MEIRYNNYGGKKAWACLKENKDQSALIGCLRKVVVGDNTFKTILLKVNNAKYRGQELVEFAIVLPLLLLVAFGVLDLGRAFHAVITITNVAREGARYGVDFNWSNNNLPDPIATGYSEIETVAFLEAQDSRLDLSLMNVTPNCGTCDKGSPLIVTVTYDFNLIMGYLPSFTLTRTATMMIP